MKDSTSVILAIIGTAGAGLAAYLLRDRATSVRLLAAGTAFVLPWAAHATLAKQCSCAFLYITDTHGPAASNRKLVQTMLEEDGISFVAHGGDLADAPQFWSVWWDVPFAPILDRWPVYAASGNHDVETPENAAEFARRFGRLPSSVRCGNVEVFFVPWLLTRESAEQLWSLVHRSESRWKVLVTHKAVWPVREDDAWRRVLLVPILDQIDLVLAGHEHVFQDRTVNGLRQIVEISGPKKYNCPESAQGCVPNSTGYLRIEACDTELRVYRKVVI
jgi:predicted phosphodiesterase